MLDVSGPECRYLQRPSWDGPACSHRPGGLRGVPHGGDHRVVGQVGAHPGAVRHHPDALLDELLGRADAGQQQQMRAADRARRQDDLPVGPGHLLHAAAQITNTGRAAASTMIPVTSASVCTVRLGRRSRRAEVGVRRRPAPSITLGDLVEAGAVLGRPVEVLVGGQPALPGGGHEGPGQRGLVLEVLHAERPGDAVVGGRAAGIVLRAEEIGNYVRVSPSGAAVVVTPGVVVEAVAPDVDHRVHATRTRRACARAASRPTCCRPFLRHGVEVPVVLALEEQVQRGRDVYLVRIVRWARFQQQDPGRGVLGEPCGQDASSAACAHDDVVVHGDLTGAVRGPEPCPKIGGTGLSRHPTRAGTTGAASRARSRPVSRERALPGPPRALAGPRDPPGTRGGGRVSGAAVSPPLGYSSLLYDATLWSRCEYPEVRTLIIAPRRRRIPGRPAPGTRTGADTVELMAR